MTTITAARRLSHKTLDTLLSRFPELREHKGPTGPHETLLDPKGEACGAVRVFEGKRIARVVYVGLDHSMIARHLPGAPTARVDSHMIFAFTPATSAVPHFTLDSIFSEAPPAQPALLAYHLDLLPRVDLASHLAYMDHVYQGAVDAGFSAMRKVEGISEPSLTPRQRALMSPWMLAHRASPEAFAQIPVDAYLERFCTLVETGIAPELLSVYAHEVLAERDKMNRAMLFDPSVDPVWAQVERVIGAAAGARIRALCKGAPLEKHVAEVASPA